MTLDVMKRFAGAAAPSVGGCRASSCLPWLLALALVCVAPQWAAAQAGVKVALLPSVSTVAPGAEFDLSMEVTRAGSPFNAFDAYVGYDPAVLTLVQLTPISNQEGAYFKAACSNRFHRFLPGVDRDTITDVLLCAGVSLTGPGQIYKLRFRASNTPQATQVRFLPGLQFYNDGLFVNPDSSSDALIGIGVTLDAAPPKIDAPLARLVPSPNPSRGNVSFRVETDRAGEQRLMVTDLQGRVVRHLEQAEFAAGKRTVTWDGKNDSGLVVPPGRYNAALHIPGRSLDVQFTILR